MASQLDIYREALLLLGDIRLGSTSDNVAARYSLDDEYDRARTFVLRQAPWRFALKQAALSSSGSPISGYSTSYAKPGDWLRTVAIFTLASARECPIDCRDVGVLIHANAVPTMRYVQNAVAVADYPEQFVKALTAYLAFLLAHRITGYLDRADSMFALWQRAFADAVKTDAVPEDPWLVHQLDGSFLASSRFVLRAGNWKFALKSALLSADVSPAPLPGFSASYPKPADWVRTQALFHRSNARESPIDAREHGTKWSANVAPTLRYVSSDALASTLWPEDFFRVVGAHLGLSWGDAGPVAPESTDDRRAARSLWPEYLQAALATEAIPESPWLAKQLDGSFRNAAQFIIEKAFWRFALKTVVLSDSATGSPPAGYSYNFDIPSDYLKLQAFFAREGVRECPIDAKETDGQWHANIAAPVARYVSNAAVSTATTWTELFTKTVAAYLGLELLGTGEAKTNAEVFAQWQAYLKQAEEVEAIEQSPWIRYQFDGSFYKAAKFILEQGFWRFALVTAALSDAGGSAIAGFSYNFARPADFLRLQSLYERSDTRECPIDARDTGNQWHANVATPVIRYLGNGVLADTTAWTQDFTTVVASYLGIGQPEGQAPNWPALLERALAVDAIELSPWLDKQFDGSFRSSAQFILEQAFWTHAIKTVTLADSGSGSPVTGYAYNFVVPVDHLKTHAIFICSDDRERPVDVRRSDGEWSSDTDNLELRYLSSASVVSAATWGEHFTRTVAAHLGLARLSIDTAKQPEALRDDWRAYLETAVPLETLRPNLWLPFQLDGTFRAASQFVLEQAFWKFALKTVVLSDDTGSGIAGYSYNLTIPADHLRTHAIFLRSNNREIPIDVRHSDAKWSTNTDGLSVRYLSADAVATPAVWTESFLAIVAARLGLEMVAGEARAKQSAPDAWLALLALASSVDALEPNVWLPYQLDGTYRQAALFVLEQGFWRFGLKIVTLTDAGQTTPTGYSNDFAIPADHIKTQAIYVLANGFEYPIDVRQTEAQLFANHTTVTLRYLARDAVDTPASWSSLFLHAVGAKLGLEVGPEFDARKAPQPLPWQQFVDAGLAAEGIGQSPWLRFQLDGSVVNAGTAMLERGCWKFALKTVSLSDGGGSAAPGFAYNYALPSDYVLTQSIFEIDSNSTEHPVDVRDSDGQLHGNIAAPELRYVSDALAKTVTDWPVAFVELVGGYLGILPAVKWEDALGLALSLEAIPQSPWLKAQLSGDFGRAAGEVLGAGFWVFALKQAEMTDDTGSPIAGYTVNLIRPTDLLRLHALFKRDGIRELPIDVRESGNQWHTNTATTTVRYLSKDYLSALTWPPLFRRAVEVRLGLAGDAVYADVLKQALDAEAIPDNPWLDPQFDGRFYSAARHTMEQGFWRFAIKTVALSDASGSALAGFSLNADKPSDFLKLHSFYERSGARELPADFRDSDGQWHTNATTPLVKYLASSTLADPALWSELFLKCVGAALGLVVMVDGSVVPGTPQPWAEAVEQALRQDGLRENPWLPHQLDGSFYEAGRLTLESGHWLFASKQVELSDAGGADLSGYTYSHARPADYIDTQAIFKLMGDLERPIDVRDTNGKWHSNFSTITLRYTSADALAPTLWTAEFLRVVGARLGLIAGPDGAAERGSVDWQAELAAALLLGAQSESPWLRPQLDGRFQEAGRLSLECGLWRFALKQVDLADAGGSAVAGYTSNFTKPADHIATQAFYRRLGDIECPIDIREAGGQWHANYATPTLRYVSSDFLISTTWTSLFLAVVGARLGLIVDDKGEAERGVIDWKATIDAALAIEGVTKSPWFEHQISGAFRDASQEVLESRYWTFALKAVSLTTSGTPVNGFTYAMPKPADWVKTQAVFSRIGDREVPIDCRDNIIQINTNITPAVVRYLSSTFMDSATWPEQFKRCVAARLGIDVGGIEKPQPWPEMVDQAAKTMAVPESAWLRHQFDGSFYGACKFVLEGGFWNFALKSVSITQSGTAASPYTYAFPKPNDWLKTRAIWTVDATREMPVDVKEMQTQWNAEATPLLVHYVSSTAGLDPLKQSEEFLHTVAVYLGIEGRDAQGNHTLPWPDYLAKMLAENGTPQSPWLRHQFDGSFARSARFMLEQGFWKFAMSEQTLTAEVSPQSWPGFTYSFVKPPALLRLRSIFRLNGNREHPIDAREHGARLSADYATPTISYLTTVGLNPLSWTEDFARCVGAHLGIDMGDGGGNEAGLGWRRYLDTALRAETLQESPWLRHQLSGDFARISRDLLNKGFWRFAIKTVELSDAGGSASLGYGYNFTKPVDFARTFALGQLWGSGLASHWTELEYRDEQGSLHANVSPITLRYVSTDGYDPVTWSEGFESAVLAFLQYEATKADPKASGAAIQAREMAWRSAYEVARKNDDISERPRVIRGAVTTAARYRGSSFSREQGWYP